MSETCKRKLIVEVLSAKNLMPKDGQGTASAYAVADFHGQRRRTKTVFRDLNPLWDETLEFLAPDTESVASETLEVTLYNDNKTGKRNTFLGKVKIAGTAFAQPGSETLVYFPLEKRSVFSQIKGELGLKVFFVDHTPAADAAAAAPPDEKKEEVSAAAAEQKPAEEKKDEKPKWEKEDEEAKTEEKKTEAAPPPEKVAHQVKEKTLVVEKTPDLGIELRSPINRRSSSTCDLVDRMPFLYVRVVKAKRAQSDSDSSMYAKLVLGTHSIKTTEKDWDQVFAFGKEEMNSSMLQASLWVEEDKEDDQTTESCLGTVSFDLQDVPKRFPPDSYLAPQWYTLESGNDIMLAVWIGTQSDEAFQEAWQSDSGGLIPETRAKVYLSPRLWYLTLTVIEAQDLQLCSGTEPPKVPNPELHVKVQLGPQLFKTGRTTDGSNPTWNEELVFVAAEPFEPFLTVTVEDAINDESVGHTKIHVPSIDKRTEETMEPKPKWYNLVGGENRPYTGRIHVKACLEGGYHVLDEAAHVTSDFRPAAKQLAKPPIGWLEIGIRQATNLLPVKTKHGTTDCYVVAKYGTKWVRTRTILDRFNPRWNEQYTWDVYDPCTVLTIGVFDNGRYKRDQAGKPGKDIRVGKIRVRLSTLNTNRVYMNSYPLTVLLPGGSKKMGEIEIALRFSCSDWVSLIQAYTGPTLPKMHYVRPMDPAQQDILRHTAMRIVTARLSRSEPPLGQEVVRYLLDSDAHLWSMRRSKANWFRVVGFLTRAATLAQWLNGIRTWVHPPTTVLMHVLLVAVVLCPHLVLPTVFMYAFLILALRFRHRARFSLTMDPRLSYVDDVGHDELDEELDGFPTTRSHDQVRIRYDRLRTLAGRAQTLLGDVAAQGERVEALLSWRDPRATGIFVVFCLVASLVLYVVPFKALVLGSGLYYLRHPRFRGDMPPAPINFFRRLPSLSDQIM